MEIQTKIHIDYRIQDILGFILSEDFVKVADTKDIQPSRMKEVQVDGENICVVNVEGKYFAINNICTHEGGPLADGTLEGYEVECPWHGSKFDVRTGEVKNPPATEPEPTYEVKIAGTDILLKKRTPAAEVSPLQPSSRPSSEYELALLEKRNFEVLMYSHLSLVSKMYRTNYNSNKKEMTKKDTWITQQDSMPFLI